MNYYFTPHSKGNLGHAYNKSCEIVPNDNDWITVMDGDVMQMHMNWGEIWDRILENNPEAGLITCKTNRVHGENQMVKEMYEETDIREHRKFALKLYAEHGDNVDQLVDGQLSGMFFSFKKSVWKAVGGFTDGILRVDNDFYDKVLKEFPCYVAKGFYVLHYYRLCEGKPYTAHLL